MRFRQVNVFYLLFFVSISGSLVSGQYREYYVVGRVVDTEKKPLPEVDIFLRDEATSRGYKTKTDKKGEFKLAGLPHGTYLVTISKEGYQTFEDRWDLQTPQDRMQKVEIPLIILATVEQIKEIAVAKEAKADFDAAIEKIRRQDFDGASAVLDRMLARNPDDANAHYLRGMVFFKKKMLEEAVAEFVKTTELAPSFAGSYHQLGLIHQQQGDAEKALEYYRRAAELDPQNVESFYNAGLILFGLNRIAEARVLFERALAINPEDPDYLEMAGRCYIHQNELEKAMAHLEKARKLSTDPEKIKFLDQLIARLKEQIKSPIEEYFFLDKTHKLDKLNNILSQPWQEWL